MSSKRPLVALALLCLAGCAAPMPPPAAPSPSSTEASVEPSPEATPEPEEAPPGDPGVYARIDAAPDCPAVQDLFDVAADNNEREEAGTPLHAATLSYMTYADERLRELDCY